MTRPQRKTRKMMRTWMMTRSSQMTMDQRIASEMLYRASLSDPHNRVSLPTVVVSRWPGCFALAQGSCFALAWLFRASSTWLLEVGFNPAYAAEHCIYGRGCYFTTSMLPLHHDAWISSCMHKD